MAHLAVALSECWNFEDDLFVSLTVAVNRPNLVPAQLGVNLPKTDRLDVKPF